jgi:hypothetical protein
MAAPDFSNSSIALNPVPSGSGGYVPYVPSPNVGAEIARVLATPGVSAAVICWPRRFGKTATSVMVLLWRFLSRSAENIAVVANSEKQVTSTAFRRPAHHLDDAAQLYRD